MANQVYPWIRSWLPREGNPVFDQHGFLQGPPDDPASRNWLTGDSVVFREISGKPCLVLLGEPGIGKTTALQQARDIAKADRPSAAFLYCHLGNYGSEQRLIDDTFKSPEFLHWAGTGGELQMFLDSFDECLLRLDSVATLLKEQVARLPRVDGLRLRITSRTAEWRTVLEDAFLKRWPRQGDVGVFELTPLTRAQVREAAKLNSIDGEAFIEEVIRKDVVAFAIKPVTLKMLFQAWKKNNGSLPPTREEIYETGCIELCAESNLERQTPRLTPTQTPEQHLAVATQIAAGMVFSKRAAVWRGQLPSEKDEVDISETELIPVASKIGELEFPITKAGFQETLNTGLFTSRGRDRMGWAHQTYGEFLAARWIRQEKISPRQTFDLILHPFDPEHRVIPQLHEVASWIANSQREVFERLLQYEPELILRGDIGRADAPTKQALVKGVLAAFADTNRSIERGSLQKMYAKLAYPGLAAQLRAALVEYNTSAAPRVEAIRMALACELVELGPDLAAIALEPAQDINVRIIAARFIVEVGTEDDKKSILPLALGQLQPDDDLKAYALQACWPKHLSARVLFQSLVPEQQRTTSRYSLFLMGELAEGLSADDLPVALDWAADQQGPPFPIFGLYRGLLADIIARGFKHTDNPETLDALARTLLARMRKHDLQMDHEMRPVANALGERPELRLKVVEAMLPHAEKADASFFSFLSFPWITRGDMDWILSKLRNEQTARTREVLAHLVMNVFFPVDAAIADKVLEEVETSEELKTAMAFWISAIDMRTEAAIRTRENFLKHEQWRAEHAAAGRQVPLSPSPAERIVELLAQSANGDVAVWWKVCSWMNADEYGFEKHSWTMEYDEKPGWIAASPEIRSNMVRSARDYLLNTGAEEDKWFDRTDLYWPAMGGLMAFLLLLEEAPSEYEALSQDVWRHWCPAIIGMHALGKRKHCQKLIADALEKVPDLATDWIVRAVEDRNEHLGKMTILWKLPEPIPPFVGQRLVDGFNGFVLENAERQELLAKIVEDGSPGFLPLLRSLLPSRVPEDEEQRKFVLRVAKLLMLRGESEDWKRIWAFIQADAGFGMALMESFRGEIDFYSGAAVPALNENEVTDLWKWMQQHYPLAQDPGERPDGIVEARASMGRLRDGLLTHLANMGTFAAVKCLEALSAQYEHEVRWLPKVVVRARDVFRRKSWQAPDPSVVYGLARNARARFVESAAQLQEVVLDALGEIQLELSGEVPASPDLWNADRPKGEEEVSDWLKRHLDHLLKGRGVVLNREVKINAMHYTDIHVDAISDDKASVETLKVIIEVKGCWNRELKTAMKTQLLDTYLANSDCRHGIYVIAWFLCDAWTANDYRRSEVRFGTADELRTYVETQAKNLSTGGKELKPCVLEALPMPRRNN